MVTFTPVRKPLWQFFVLIFILSAPLWLISPVVGFPLYVLNAFQPLLATALLTYHAEGGEGVRRLVNRSVDFWKITHWRWYLPILGLVPAIYLVVYGIKLISDAPLPPRPTPLFLAPALLMLFFLLAVGEEVGWSGYALPSLQKRWNALTASLVLGVIWAAWHIVPDLQAHHTLSWIGWQRLYSVLLRILLVWVFNNTRGSIFAVSLCHATDNMSFILFPYYGSHYDPALTCLVTAIVAALVVWRWGPATLARFRRPQFQWLMTQRWAASEAERLAQQALARMATVHPMQGSARLWSRIRRWSRLAAQWRKRKQPTSLARRRK